MFTPSTATVEGPASLVRTVQNVVVALNVAGRRGSVDQNLPLRVLDARLDWKWIAECWCYAFHGFGVRPGGAR